MQQKKEVKIRLAESFRELVLEKPIEKITIKEITDRAGVIRVTFYNHFQDKYELLEWIIREEAVEPARVLLHNNMEQEALAFLFNSIKKNRDFYVHVVRLEGQNSFESIICGCFIDVITDYLAGHVSKGTKKYKWLTPQRVGEFYGRSLTYIIISWIKSGMDASPEEMVETYNYIAHHSLLDLPTQL